MITAKVKGYNVSVNGIEKKIGDIVEITENTFEKCGDKFKKIEVAELIEEPVEISEQEATPKKKVKNA